jgi:hypothetical protein
VGVGVGVGLGVEVGVELAAGVAAIGGRGGPAAPQAVRRISGSSHRLRASTPDRREQPLAAGQHDGMHAQHVLIDQVVLDRRVEQDAAAASSLLLPAL